MPYKCLPFIALDFQAAGDLATQTVISITNANVKLSVLYLLQDVLACLK